MARIPLRPGAGGEEADGEALLEEGMFLASRSAEQAQATERGRVTRRAYDLRSRTRTTPHGIFAAVAAAPLTASTSVLRLGDAHRAVTVPSPALLAEVANRALRVEPELLFALTLTAAPWAATRGDRLEAGCPAPGGMQPASVRATTVSLWLLSASRDGIAATDLIATLMRRHPRAAEQHARRAVLDMIDTGLLLTDLVPANAGTHPLRHLLAKMPATAAVRPALDRLDQILARCDELAPGAMARRALLAQAREVADALYPTHRPLVVDTVADAEIALPPKVGEKAAQAAGVLWRIGHRHGPLIDYHRRFCTVYGRHRLVPLREVLDSVTGLGPPGPADALGRQEEPRQQRTAALARLLADAVSSPDGELVLGEEDIDQLANPSVLPPPRTAEIHVQLLRAQGGVRIAVRPGTGSQTAGAAPGRWIRHLPHLAPRQDRDVGSGTMTAEIVCRPGTGPASALSAETGAAPWRIPLGVPARPGDLMLDDLALTTNGTHLILWSTVHHRPVASVLYNRLAPQHLPPAAYLLHLLGHADARPWHPWSWYPLTYWPATPRVRYRDILLAPARWRIPEPLAAAAAHRAAFDAHLTAWHTHTRPAPPPVLVAEEADRHLPLDLRHADQRELLRRSIHRGTRTLAEPMAPLAEQTVVEGPNGARHLLDLVVPLTRRHAPPPALPDPRAALRTPGSGAYLPGSQWLSATLTAPARLHDTVLSELTPLLTHLAPQVNRWFWLRYTTPALGPHLRLRWHADPQTLAGLVQPQLAEDTDRLHRRGLLPTGALRLEPYAPEIERWGGPHAITAAEHLFCADSRLALAALVHTEDQRLLLAAISAADIARTLAPDHAHLALAPGRLTPLQRRRRDTLRPQLTQATTTLLTEADLATAHTERHTALTTYRDTLAPPHAARCASDVIHLHANRMLTTDPGHEHLMRSLAADLLHRP
ncbi:thiopeptide-type bacteriocin biosynthesis protein [Streptomyces zagrosensis]|uniref:Thiopeptide-type bacteriocin biosynthesis protein n=2 Tax=Streptomyces zagrosensis TaxID=1042984 RepID=A0A7W9V0Y4_9ACTN|nr:thiopeptide-type bacteriocin biosynthesis protein [Streptomyces zagrosensis]